MTKTFSDQLGHDGITLNVVHPGLTMTEGISQTLDQRAGNQGVTREELEKQMSAITSTPTPSPISEGGFADPRHVVSCVGAVMKPGYSRKS